ncbi:hypothetical protein GCM10018781_24430 [Kitasatospora indigofera]|uniref:ABM domain-containing protein n=1 Tax=Kitasatospora indigofera TaxID=67307 RepID=A0A919KPG2_9ACTN|nr:hypothetical protein [Kitasatospora indigofera]GHH68191.1 hypothetical protein GCM10018781_24430 [Kitasatospora indigofera]
MTLAAMWEARAADGRAAELTAWVHATALPALRGAAGLERTEVLGAPGGRVLLVTWWEGAPVAVADPPADLVARPVHRWEFTSQHVE